MRSLPYMTAALIAISIQSVHAQNCDSVLIQRNTTAIQRSNYLRIHALSVASDSEIRSESDKFSALTPKGKYDAESARETQRNTWNMNNVSYTKFQSEQVMLSNLPDGAVQFWAQCVQSVSSAPMFYAIPRSPREDSVEVKLVWYPGSFHPKEDLTVTKPDGSNLTLAPGETTVVIPRSLTRDLSVSFNARSSQRALSAPIFVPGRKTFDYIVYLKDGDEVSGSCKNADGVPCVGPGQPIFTGPPEGGLSSVSFYVPNGARRFEAELSPADCNAGAAVGYVDASGGRILTFNWPAQRSVKTDLPPGTHVITFGADANGTRQCDSVQWLAPRVIVRETYGG